MCPTITFPQTIFFTEDAIVLFLSCIFYVLYLKYDEFSEETGQFQR